MTTSSIENRKAQAYKPEDRAGMKGLDVKPQVDDREAIKPAKGKDLTIILPDVQAAEKRLQVNQDRALKILDEIQELEDSLTEADTFRERFVITGASELAQAALERNSRAHDAAEKALSRAKLLSSATERVGVFAAQTIREGFDMGIPVVVAAGSEPKIDGEHILVLVKSAERDSVAELKIVWVVDRRKWRPTAHELRQVLDAAGVVLAEAAEWRVTDPGSDLGDGLRRTVFEHSNRITSPPVESAEPVED